MVACYRMRFRVLDQPNDRVDSPSAQDPMHCVRWVRIFGKKPLGNRDCRRQEIMLRRSSCHLFLVLFCLRHITLAMLILSPVMLALAEQPRMNQRTAAHEQAAIRRDLHLGRLSRSDLM
jgi:hypothetical protein